MTVAGISFAMYVLAGFVQNWIIVLPVGIALTIGTLFVLRATVGKESATAYREPMPELASE